MTDRVALRVAVKTLGCKVNRAESEAIMAELLGDGVLLADESQADVVVVNTCTVTREADAKVRKAVRQALAEPQGPVVVVTGCLAALEPGSFAAHGGRVVVEADKTRVARLVAELRGPSTGCRPAEATAPSAPEASFRTRVAVKIEDGCDAFCTYCIVPYARGVPRAVPLADIASQVAALVDAGTREVVLTGINIGRYDDAGRDLADVIAAVAETGVERIRLSSVEPLDLTPRLLHAMATTASFCAHLHVPLQAGSDPVLSEMGRGYTVSEFARRLEAARAALPGLVVTSDVLAGFPGETAEHAAETLAFCEQVGFAKLHVFRYSPRPGTPAAERTDQVPAAEKSARAAALRTLSARLEAAHAASALGRCAEVLVERIETLADGTLVAEGTSRDYLRVQFSAAGERLGELAEVRLTQTRGGKVLGERLL